jgi:hypothetical protein
MFRHIISFYIHKISINEIGLKEKNSLKKEKWKMDIKNKENRIKSLKWGNGKNLRD